MDLTQAKITGHTRVGKLSGPNRATRPTPSVVFVFDGAYQSVIEHVLPEAAAQGIAVCLAAASDYVGGGGRATAEMLWAAQGSGHEILSHAADGTGVTDLTDLATSRELLENHGLAVESLVTPGTSSTAIEEAARKIYRAAMNATGSPYYNDQVLDTYRLRRMDITDVLDGTDAGSVLTAAQAAVAAIQALYDADTDGRLLIFYATEATANGVIGFRALVDTIQATSDCEVLTLSAALDKHESVFEVGVGEGRFGVGPGGAVHLPQLATTASIFGVTSPRINGHLRVYRMDGPNRTPTPTPTVVFRLDDLYATQLLATAIAEAEGFGICLAAISSVIGTSGRFTGAQLQTLEAAGHEILNHSKSHYTTPDHGYSMRDLLNPDSVRYDYAAGLAEIVDSQAALEALGLTVESFCNPNHETDTRTQLLLRQYFRAAASMSSSPYISEAVLNTYAINAYPINNVFTNADTGLRASELAAAKALIDDLQDMYSTGSNYPERDGRLLMFYGHGCTAAGMEYFQELVDYIQATDDVEILTLSQALDKHENIFEQGLLDTQESISGGEARRGFGFGVGANGSLRSRGMDVTGPLRFFNPRYPFSGASTCAIIEWDSNNLVITPYAGADVIINTTGSLKPLTNFGADLGEDGYAWGPVKAEELNVSTVHKAHLATKSDTKHSYTVNAGTATIIVPVEIPAGACRKGAAIRVRTAITGPTSWAVELCAKADPYTQIETIASGLAVAKNTITSCMFEDQTPLAAAAAIKITASGGTGTFDGGAIDVSVFYETIVPMGEL